MPTPAALSGVPAAQELTEHFLDCWFEMVVQQARELGRHGARVTGGGDGFNGLHSTLPQQIMHLGGCGTGGGAIPAGWLGGVCC